MYHVDLSMIQRRGQALFVMQVAYADADSASTAMQAVAPIGVVLLKNEKLVLQ